MLCKQRWPCFIRWFNPPPPPYMQERERDCKGVTTYPCAHKVIQCHAIQNEESPLPITYDAPLFGEIPLLFRCLPQVSRCEACWNCAISAVYVAHWGKWAKRNQGSQRINRTTVGGLWGCALNLLRQDGVSVFVIFIGSLVWLDPPIKIKLRICSNKQYWPIYGPIPNKVLLFVIYCLITKRLFPHLLQTESNRQHCFQHTPKGSGYPINNSSENSSFTEFQCVLSRIFALMQNNNITSQLWREGPVRCERA